MKVENNFFSIVAIGSFNPDILTPKFLEENCEIKFSGTPQYKSMTNMISDIDSGKITYLMQINRFQITEKGIVEFSKNQIVAIMCKYLSILKYTPIAKMGFNFNVILSTDNNKKLIKKIYQEKGLAKFLNAERLSYNIVKEYQKQKEENFLSLKVSIPLKENCSENLHIKDGNGKFIVNYNYEFTSKYFMEECNRDRIIEKSKKRMYEILNYLESD